MSRPGGPQLQSQSRLVPHIPASTQARPQQIAFLSTNFEEDNKCFHSCLTYILRGPLRDTFLCIRQWVDDNEKTVRGNKSHHELEIVTLKLVHIDHSEKQYPICGNSPHMNHLAPANAEVDAHYFLRHSQKYAFSIPLLRKNHGQNQQC